MCKVNDRTAIVVMRRVSVDRPEFELAQGDTMPMSAVPKIADPPPVVPLGAGQSIEDERERFRAMLNGRRPTGQEVAEFEARLLVIQRARGNKTDELLRREAQQRSPTPDHPDVGFDPTTATWITGPRLKVEYAKGSLEHALQQNKGNS